MKNKARSKFDRIMVKFNLSNDAVAKSLRISSELVRKWRIKGVSKKVYACALAYILTCDFGDILEGPDGFKRINFND